MLGIVLDVEPVKGPQDAHEAHDVAENQAEAVDASEDQVPIQELDLAEQKFGLADEDRGQR